MTRYEQICVEPVGRVLKLTLNRPEKLNAWTRQMEAEFITAVREAAADDSVGCIVVTGAGRAFCAGADMGGWRERHESANQPGANRSLLLSTDLSREAGPNVAPALFEGKPVIAAINGPAIGVGLTLSLACDIRIASEAARFSIRFVRVGLTPELASTHNLASVAGMEAAMELALTGRIIAATDPLRAAVGKPNCPRGRTSADGDGIGGGDRERPAQRCLAGQETHPPKRRTTESAAGHRIGGCHIPGTLR